MCINLNCHAKSDLGENIRNVSSFLKNTNVKEEYLKDADFVIIEPVHLFKRLRMLWKQMEDVMLINKLPPNFSVSLQAEEILKGLESCLSLCNDIISSDTRDTLGTQIKLFRRSIIRLGEMEDSKLCKLNKRALANETSGIYLYFHTYLSIHWNLTLLSYRLYGYNCNVRDEIVEFVKDLRAIGLLNPNYVYLREPFLCPCVKTVWIGVQLLLETQSSQEFWDVFNTVFSKTEPLPSIWMLHHIATLHGYNENGEYIGPDCKRVTPNQEFLELKLKKLLDAGVSHSDFLNVEPLVNLWWSADLKVTIFQQLWEYFYKLLNAATKESPPDSALKLLKAIEALSREPRCARTPFEYFVGMLAKHLSRHPSHWSKLKGRIYCRVPVHKINSLNEYGLRQIYVMFIALAPVDFEELTGRISSMLENLSPERRQCVTVCDLHCALILLHLKHGRPVHKLAKPILEIVQECMTPHCFYVVRRFVNNLAYIMSASPNYALGQFAFLGGWVRKHLQDLCERNIETFVPIFANIVDKVYESDDWAEWDLAFQIHVFPALKQLAILAMGECACEQVGKFAAALSKASPELSNQAVAYFTEDRVNPRVSEYFLVELLSNQLPLHQEDRIIRTWLRCSLLSTADNGMLTSYVLALPAFRGKFETGVNSFCKFLEALAKQNDRVQETVIKLLLDHLTHVDSWVKPHLKEGEDLVHMYTCVGNLVCYFAPFLYNKTKSACLLSRIISTFLLPAEILMGRPPHENVLTAVTRTWQLFVKGIFALNWNDDAFLERTLKDLIVCYVSHLPTYAIEKCFVDENVACAILQKMTVATLGQSSKCNKEQCVKVLRFLDCYMRRCESVTIMKAIAQNVVVVLLEFMLFNLHCNAAVSPLISLASFGLYDDMIKTDVQNSIIVVTEKHLAFNSNNLFQLLQILVKVIPTDMKELLPRIRQCVASVEKVRGVGFDSMLRKGLSSIEEAVSV